MFKDVLEQRTTKVSLAIRLTDDFAPSAPPRGEATVSLTPGARRAMTKATGYSVFVDLAPGTYTVHVRSALYLPEDRQVSVPHANPLDPVLAVPLKPRWSYPFPVGTTLIQGLLREEGGAPIASGAVKTSERPAESVSADDGRFVLY